MNTSEKMQEKKIKVNLPNGISKRIGNILYVPKLAKESIIN
jgi:hypothetical protein